MGDAALRRRSQDFETEADRVAADAWRELGSGALKEKVHRESSTRNGSRGSRGACGVGAGGQRERRSASVGTYKGSAANTERFRPRSTRLGPGIGFWSAPGNHKTTSSSEPAGRKDTPAGVLITKPRIYVRRDEPQQGDHRRDQVRAPLAAARGATRTSVRAARADVSDSTASWFGRPPTSGSKT